MSVPALSSPTYYPQGTLTKPKAYPGVFLLELQARPDNRLSDELILGTILPALSDVEREFRASRNSNLGPAESNDGGWEKPKSPGEYALVTCGPRDKNRFYSNGLNLESVAQTDGFFQHILFPMYHRLLTLPIPTICALNGHAFAAGFCLAMVHDFRVMKEGEAKGRAQMAMNEVEFGAHIPMGLMTIIEAKMPNKNWARKCFLEAHRFGAAQSLELGIVDKLVPEAETVDEACKLGSTLAIRATTGVYGMIKASLYKPQVDILAQHEGYHSPVFEDDYRTMKLGDEHAGKAKL